MARFEVDGMDELMLSMEELSALPDEILDNMLLAEADVVVRAQKTKGRAYGVHKTGMTLASIRAGRPRRKSGGKSITIAPEGTNADGNRNAEIAFINEYGKSGQRARPFIRDANEEAAEQAVSAAEVVYNRWLDSR